MATNLSIENLSRAIDFGDTGAFMGRSQAQTEARMNQLEIGRGLGADGVGAAGDAKGGSGTTFADMLRQSLDTVNTHQAQADMAVKELVAGRTKNVHETMLAVERADASLKLAVQVRNKILDAYREVMRMQV